MNIQQMFEELDELFNANDVRGAGACMNRWLMEARSQKDWQSELTILNEQIGYYRKTGNRAEGMETVLRAFQIVDEHGLESHAAGATTWLNGATALRTFGEYKTSYFYFEKTMNLYKKLLEPQDYRFASLYNNMALLLSDLKRGKEAESFFLKSLEILENNPAMEAETANTYVSMAHMYHSMETDPEIRQEKVREMLRKALGILKKNNPLPDSYFAYICETCAKSFRYFGMESEESELKAMAENYYHRKGAE